MSAETKLYDALSTASPVTTIVGARIYPDFLAQEITLPAIVYQRGGTEYINTITTPNVFQRVSLEIWCLAATRIAADGLAAVVESVFQTALEPIYPQDRTPQFDSETETFASVIVCDVWQ